MSETIVAAEVVPLPGRSHSAAKALQQLGFRVLHIGTTISVQAPEKVWEETFRISFQKRRKQRLAGLEETEVEYAVPAAEPVSIPVALQELVAEVAFVEPPQFFHGG